jgi:xanthine dehydrogenase molybdopterin-binding subunit B
MWGSVMSSAIELIVDGYARLKDRQSLEDLRMHRRRLAVDLKAKVGFDYRGSIAQVEQDIAAIEAGLKTLSGPISG